MLIFQTKDGFGIFRLKNNKVSVGIVAEHSYLFNGSTKNRAEIFDREINNNAWIADHLKNATQVGEYRVTVNTRIVIVIVLKMDWCLVVMLLVFLILCFQVVCF